MDEMKYSVLVVDDHPLMRKGIVQLLELEDNIEVIGEASNGTDAVAMAKESEPDLILLDLNMKGLSGLDTLKALRAEEVTSRVVILTVSDARQDVVALLKAGADGYLLKDTEPDMLLGQLADVMTGKQILSEPLRPYLENIYELDHLQQKLESLTRREMQIMREIAKGLSNKQVASVLHISEGTVKVHVKSLLKKLEAQSRVEAAVTNSTRQAADATVTLSLLAPGGETVAGRVRTLAPTVDGQTRNALVYADVEATAGKTLGPGMFVRGEFELGRREALTLPQAAVVLREGFTYVFRLEGEGSETATNTAAATATAKVALTKVGTGRRLGERIEVAGLAPDARVVASGAGFLADGDTVRLVAPETAAVTPAASATKAAP